MPSLDLSRVSFAAMGGSAAPVGGMYAELARDLPDYHSDDSDDDLDGMEAAAKLAEQRLERAERLRAADASVAAERAKLDALRKDIAAHRARTSAAAATGAPAASGAKEVAALAELRKRREALMRGVAELQLGAAEAAAVKAMHAAGAQPPPPPEYQARWKQREHEAFSQPAEARPQHAEHAQAAPYQARWKQREAERFAREAEAASAALEAAERARVALPAPAPVASTAGRHGREPAVFAAIAANDLDGVLRYLRSGGPTDARDAAGDTALIASCRAGRKRITKALVKAGADLNARGSAGNTALHRCFAGNQLAVADYLVSEGASDDVENDAGLSCYEGIAS